MVHAPGRGEMAETAVETRNVSIETEAEDVRISVERYERGKAAFGVVMAVFIGMLVVFFSTGK